MTRQTKIHSFDLLVFIYILINIVLIAVGSSRINGAGYHLGAFVIISILIYVLIKGYNEKSGKIITFLRYWYPFILFGYFFEVTTIANKVFFPEFIDPFFMKIDQWMFGYQPVVEWGLRYENNVFVQEILYFAYFTYYILFPGVGLLVYFKKRESFVKYTFTVVFSFYACYLTYLILPVVGGRYFPELAEIATTYKGGPFRHIMAFIYTHSNHFGSAFPSSHVALAITATIAAGHYFGKLGYYLSPIPILIMIATVFCHYHYFIDVIFGVIYGVGLYYPAVKLYEKLENNIQNRMKSSNKQRKWSYEQNAKTVQ
ncbi:MAG: phosphatase PAP2 family protein [Candidatus Cloacimonas sp.]|nr:phosphatase PAP2 family protein [Candidatus Cloacimonadota bacterium]